MITTIKTNNDLETLVYYSSEPVHGLVNIHASETSCNRLGYALRELEEYPAKAEQIAKDAIRVGRKDPKRGLIWTLAVLHEVGEYTAVKDAARWDGEKWAYDTSLNIAVGKARKEFGTQWETSKEFGFPKHVFMGLLLLGKEINIVGDPALAGTWVEAGIDRAEEYLAEYKLPAPVLQPYKQHCECGAFLRSDGGCTRCENRKAQE